MQINLLQDFFFWNTETCLKCTYTGAERDKIISSCKQISVASRNGLLVNLKPQELGIFRSARRAQPAVTRRRAPLTRTQLRNIHKKKKKKKGGQRRLRERVQSAAVTQLTSSFSSAHATRTHGRAHGDDQALQIRCATHMKPN